MNAILLQCGTQGTSILKCGCNNVAETNWQDVVIISVICIAVVLFTLIAKCAILSWKDKEIKAKEDERKDKEIKEEKEYNRRKAADEKSREWQLEDEQRKRANAIADEERKRKYAQEDEERRLKNDSIDNHE